MPDNNEGGTRDMGRHDQSMGGMGSWVSHIVRFVVSALVLMAVGL